MNTCKTCKYWSVRHSIKNNVGDCDMVYRIPVKGITFEIEATANYDSGMTVGLLTSGNFGCILHSPKK